MHSVKGYLSNEREFIVFFFDTYIYIYYYKNALRERLFVKRERIYSFFSNIYIYIYMITKMHSVKGFLSNEREFIKAGRRPTTESKETYYSVKRDLLQSARGACTCPPGWTAHAHACARCSPPRSAQALRASPLGAPLLFI
jgi:hypothetical protein